jgi:glycosyltransferase involved in cell wall biosynthesis
MRILMVVQAYYPFQEKGGPVVKVRAIARGLASRGHSITVLTADHGFQPSLCPDLRSEKCPWGWRLHEGNIEAVFLRTWGRYRSLTLNPGVVNFAIQSLGSFDLAHIYGLYDLIGPIIGKFCRQQGVPYFVEPMGMFRPIVRSLRMKKAYLYFVGNRLLSGARRLIATSEQEKQELVDGGVAASRIVVRRNGVEAPTAFPPKGSFRAKWNIPQDAKVVLFLGRLVSKKSPEMLIEAYGRWVRKSNDATNSVLVIAGPEEDIGYTERLKRQAHSSGISNRVLFTGPLFDDAKWAAYRDADVFVLPSRNENFGNTAAEAIVSGTPVIVTDQCGIAPWLDQTAGLIVPHDVSEVESALYRLLQDSRMAGRFRAGCAEVTRNLSWEAPLDFMEETYRESILEPAHANGSFLRQTT